MLKLRSKNSANNAVWLVEPKVTIGRDSGCDLVLDHADIQARHAEIRVNHEQLHFLLLIDTDSTFINGKRVPKGKLIPLKPQYTIRLADTEFQVIDPKQETRSSPTLPRQDESTGWALKANHSALANRIFTVKSQTLVGRSNECDVTLAAAHLSRRHAELSVREGLLFVRDLGSANGTFVNGKRVEAEVRVKRGDDLRFDTLSFGVIGPTEDLDKTTVRTVTKRTAAPSAAAAHPKPARSGSVPVKPQRSRPEPKPQVAAASTAVETVAPSNAAGRTLVLGAGLLVVIAMGGYLLWQNAGF